MGVPIPDGIELQSGHAARIEYKVDREKTLRCVPWLMLLFVFIAGLGDAVQAIPMLQTWRFLLCQADARRDDLSAYSAAANDFAASAMCQKAEISKGVANLDGWLNAIGMIVAVLSGLLYGRISDVRGRIPILQTCAVGTLVSQVLTLLALQYWRVTGIWGIYGAEVILGLTGGGPVLIATCYAVLTDVLEEEARLKWFARSVGVWYASRIIGPVMGTWLLNYQLLAPVYCSVVLFAGSVPILFVLPETLPDAIGKPKHQFNAARELKEALSAMSFCVRDHNLRIITMANLSYYFGIQIISLLTIYVNMLGWSMEDAGYLSAYQAVIKCIVAVAVVPYMKQRIIDRWSISSGEFDVRTAQLSFATDALSWLLVAVLPTAGLLPAIALGSLGIAASSSIRALAAAQVQEDHGRLFACLGVVDALGAAIASPLLAHIYGHTVEKAPEVIFLVVAIIFGSSSILFHWYHAAADAEHDRQYRPLQPVRRSTLEPLRR